MWNIKRGKRLTSFILLLSLLLVQTACGHAEEEDKLIIADSEAEETVYSLVVATIGDVIDTESIRCTYVQVNDEEISFPVSGKVVAAVYVASGEEVQKGQLLAELMNEGVAEEIKELEYTIERNQILLEQSVADEEDELYGRWLQFQYKSNLSEAAIEAWEADNEAIEQRYEYLREDYNDAIYAAQLRLEELNEEVAQGRIYAGMSGTVSYVKPDLEGSVSVKDETVIKIIDGSECVFESESVEYADCFTEDMQAEFLIVTDSGAMQCHLKPFEMESWGERLYFVVAEDDMELNVGVGNAGTLKVITAQKTQVLTIPARAVHVADGKSYVYVVGEDNMREVKWIETGMYGDSMVEILSGLNEGEKVILR
ncbi:MAG: biotin/lipoyl-binding protein [Lachnospiraceae bacterium]|nr:biotin/lipoyl-binding protein [Lachnospiraceae bacterium]